MEKIIKELEQVVSFKKTTTIGDIVLIVAKEPQQVFMYAMVTDIERDSSRKDEWWHVHMTILGLPMQHVTWTLRTAQMQGEEIFTMGGEERFIVAVETAAPESENKPAEKKKEKPVRKIHQIKRVK